MQISRLIDSHAQLDGQVTRVSWALHAPEAFLSNSLRADFLKALGEHALLSASFANTQTRASGEVARSATFIASCWASLYTLLLKCIQAYPDGTEPSAPSQRQWSLLVDQVRPLLATEIDLVHSEVCTPEQLKRVRMITC